VTGSCPSCHRSFLLYHGRIPHHREPLASYEPGILMVQPYCAGSGKEPK
jgi:hypothetical protein